MALAFDISVLGDKQLERKLAELEPKIQKKHGRKAMRAAAKVIQKAAKSLVPVDTGALRKSIKVRSMKRSRKFSIGVLVRTGTRAELGIDPDEKGYRPSSTEFGTKNAPAQPYMRPALDTKRQEALNVFQTKLWQVIKSEATKL